MKNNRQNSLYIFVFDKTFIILYSLFLLLLGCAAGERKTKTDNKEGLNDIADQSPYHINLPEKGEDPLKASFFADTVLYVPLETNSQSIFRGINQIQVTDKYIFINARDRLLLFSKDGKFIRQIGKKGKGPGEYLMIFGFVVVQDTIYISSTGKRSLLVYHVNGDFLKEQLTPFQLTHFNVTPDNRIVSYNRIGGTLIYFDKQLNVADTITIEKNVSSKRAIYSLWDDWATFFLKSDCRLLFTYYRNDTIWDVSNGRKDAGYVLNLGDKLLPEKCQIEFFNGDFKRFMKIATPYQKVNLIETPSYVLLFQRSWMGNDINTTYIHDVASNTTRKFETPYIFDDLVGKRNLIPRYYSNNCVIATINPVLLKEELKTENRQKETGSDSFSPLWLTRISKVTENDNMILVIMPVRNVKL